MDDIQFAQALEQHQLKLSAQQKEQFEQYYSLLIEWNKKMNLTALTTREDVYVKHFYDSLSPAFYYDFFGVSHVADVGAGAGFPGIPLKICFPHLQLTVVDSLKKRISFLEHLTDRLNLSGVNVLHARAEEIGQMSLHREQYELVLARAVAKLPVLAELCLPLVKVGGQFIAMKGQKGLEEANESRGVLGKLGGSLRQVNRFHLPCEAGERQLLVIDKLKPTPKRYPRQPGVPAKNPLT
jgi:16S rRNA (guanine527-N7)-methyltransferase